jgi:hypothetical protein
MDKSRTSRFASFFSRIETERTVLSTVNHAFGPYARLHGLTLCAIDQWHTEIRQNQTLTASIESDVLPLLRRISARCDAEADQSRVVFDDEPDRILVIDELLDELHALCGN